MISAIRLQRSRKLRIGILVWSALLLAAINPHPARAQYLHPKITKKEVTVRKVVILPAKVDVVRDSMKGPEGMAAESEELSGRVEKAVADVLANSKHITMFSAPAPSGGGDAQGKYTVADMQTRFDELLPKVMKKRKAKPLAARAATVNGWVPANNRMRIRKRNTRTLGDIASPL